MMTSAESDGFSRTAMRSVSSVDGDLFGYQLSDVPLDWIDATDGTALDFEGRSYGQATGEIPLPFTFRYYEHSYDYVMIAASGYLAFEPSDWPAQFYAPNIGPPNNIIAPLASVYELNASGDISRVYYKSGGVAPNQYFVVEWHKVNNRDYYPNGWTFQVILHENGNIDFQYADVGTVGGYTCPVAAIEDSTGADGIPVIEWCERPESSVAKRFTRPADAPRVRVLDLAPGVFLDPDTETELVPIDVRNTGDLGPDTYDIQVTSPWPVTLYAADGVTPLSDSDGDTMIDTGAVDPVTTITVYAAVDVPETVGVGEHNLTEVAFSSSLDPSISATSAINLAVPLPFAQVAIDGRSGPVDIDLVKPDGQGRRQLSTWGSTREHAIAETPNGFAYAWSKLAYYGGPYAEELWFALTDPYGRMTVGPLKITDHSTSSLWIQDEKMALSVAPNGTIGLIWFRYERDTATSEDRYNIHFMLLAPDGSAISGPQQITNNAFGSGGPQIRSSSPQIAATSDNRFAIAWSTWYNDPQDRVNNVEYAVLATDGSIIQPRTYLATGTPNEVSHGDVSITSAGTNNAVVTWIRSFNGVEPDDVWFAVIGSSGALTRAPANLSADGDSVVDLWNEDVIELAGGHILAVWVVWGCDSEPLIWRLRYAVLDSDYNLIAPPACLGAAPEATLGETGASVVVDGAGNGAILWEDTDSSPTRLYYAAVNSAGEILTPPMTRRISSPSRFPYLHSSYSGNGATTYTHFIPDAVDGESTFGVAEQSAQPGGSTWVNVTYDNLGLETATGAVMTLTVDARLTYVEDTSELPVTVTDNSVVFDIGEVSFVGGQTFAVKFAVSAAAELGDTLSLAATLVTAESDSDPTNNSDNMHVVARNLIYMPFATRQ